MYHVALRHVTLTDLSLSAADCYVTVPPRYHPPPAEIKDGFSMSAWLQVGRDVDGYVLSKTSADGARQFYALKISTAISFTAGARTVTVELRYSLPKNAVRFFFSILDTVALFFRPRVIRVPPG